MVMFWEGAEVGVGKGTVLGMQDKEINKNLKKKK